MTLRTYWSILKQTASEWSEDNAPRLAAALSYYTLFSLAPLLIIAIAVAGFIFGREAAEGEVVAQLRGLMGEQGAAAVQAMVRNASDLGSGVLATLLSLGVLVFAATGAFAELQSALNTIWEVQPRPDLGILHMIRQRLLSFAMVLGIGFLLLVSLVLSAALAAAGKLLNQAMPWLDVWGQVLGFVVSFVVIALLFAMIFKFLPDVKIRWRDVWLGAVITALLFSLGKLLIGLYLGRSSATSVYGAAGSLVLVLIWVYYSAQILFFGAEFTQVYARRIGETIEPDENAVALTEDARVHQGIPHRSALHAAPAAPTQGWPQPVAALVRAHTVIVRQPERHGRLVPLAVGFLLGRVLRRRRRAVTVAGRPQGYRPAAAT